MAPATIKRAEDDEDMRNDVIDESLMNEVVEDEFDSSEDGEVETSAVVEDDSNINLDTEDTAPVTVEERASVDTSKVFGSNGSDFGGNMTNTKMAPGTSCYLFGKNAWQISIPHDGVFEVNVDLYAPGVVAGSVVVRVERQALTSPSNTTAIGSKLSLSTAVHVKDTKLTLSSPNANVALCGVKVNLASGTVVQIQVHPAAPSGYGTNMVGSNGEFHVDNSKLVSAFSKMTHESEERFVVTEISSAPNGDMIADVLIRALPTDSDLDQSAFIAEFSTLSGDSLWQRSGLQIQRMEVSSKKQKIPTWGVATMAAVIPFVIAFALVVILAVVIRKRLASSPRAQSEYHVQQSVPFVAADDSHSHRI